MYQEQKILLGKAGETKQYMYPKMANRHGIIAGATGTGKTVTLKVMAESFSSAGVPVFLADVKGDLAGMCQPGIETDDMKQRLERFQLGNENFAFHAFPTQYWDVYGEKGLPLRTTISEMGPLLLSRILNLNDTQEGVLNVVFRVADDEGLLLIDTKDLRSMLQYVSEKSKEYSLQYGNVSKQSIAAILRALLQLEDQGGSLFFGEPAINVSDWIARDTEGRGIINVLDCQKLILNPTMYSTFLLWMLSELYELLPEVGDLEKPKMVFFFDEAHLLFKSASKNLLEKITQVVKLIRSKGVGIFFVTQSPTDISNDVLSQLGTKIQHALHAYTPAEKKTIKAVSDSFRENPAFDTSETLQNLGIGEALFSTLDESGIPTMVEKVSILPPESKLGSISPETRDQQMKASLLYSKYTEYFDRDSAYEFFERMHLEEAQAALKEEQEKTALKESAKLEKEKQKESTKLEKERQRAIKSTLSTASGTVGREIGKTVGKSIGGSFGKTLGGNVGASIGRGLLKTLFKS